MLHPAIDPADLLLSEEKYLEIRRQAELLSGPENLLRQRARGYLDIYNASGATCRFALVAAQGALWAAWYLEFARVGAFVFAFVDPAAPYVPRARYNQFSRYIACLKNINKLVMMESHVLVHTVRDLGVDFAVQKGFPRGLAVQYEAAMSDGHWGDEKLRNLYEQHFLWEQERVVSDMLTDAFALFTWKRMKHFCERPWVWFSYFRTGKSMNFKSFTDPAERLEKGLIAYDRAVEFGVTKLFRITDMRLKVLSGKPTLPALRAKFFGV